ncbi:MAG: UMP kinase, partial [Chloroflexi bacterium]|nr:UMP kinase [Chloroflexota bacterium]
MTTTRYKRVLLKLSGEAFSGDKNYGIDAATLIKISQQIKQVVDMGIELAIVVGGGNIWRGSKAAEDGFDRVTAD